VLVGDNFTPENYQINPKYVLRDFHQTKEKTKKQTIRESHTARTQGYSDE